MYWINVNTREWVDGGRTEIRVGFSDEAKAEAERWSTPQERVIERCFWRTVYERWEQVRGDEVEFLIDLKDV